MKLLIDIPENYYEILKHEVEVNHYDGFPTTLIVKGIPLQIITDRLKTMHTITDSEGQDYWQCYDVLKTLNGGIPKNIQRTTIHDAQAVQQKMMENFQ